MTNMQSHLRLNMTATATVKRELKRTHDELKRDFDNLLSVVSTELSLMDIFPNNRKPLSGIGTILTSLTTMIQPDGTTHCVHMSNKLGIFRDPDFEWFCTFSQVSSPPLCIYPG